ncbi:ferredoxin [Desulforhopalus vacuolatus]|uniref:ferredoxin n=1 Tax=Desulforhopalus vacuolatus TaxID=40414 RepID=UPI001962D864|nr:ferredoxin [Desulforhopalus vacuolatus]MBM9519875.1 ferredoxin [Desulforhopalus vacuolatus]
MEKTTKRFPVIDSADCNLCQGCVDVEPDVFYYDENSGRIVVQELAEYPVAQVDEAIKNCPRDCISWDILEKMPLSRNFTEEEILGIG